MTKMEQAVAATNPRRLALGENNAVGLKKQLYRRAARCFNLMD